MTDQPLISVLRVGGPPDGVDRLAAADDRLAVEPVDPGTLEDRLYDHVDDLPAGAGGGSGDRDTADGQPSRCVVIDHDPPALDAVGVVERLRADRRNLPVVVVGDAGTTGAALRAGATDCHPPSAGPAALAARVRTAVNRHRKRAAAARRERRLAALLERSGDRLSVLDEAGRYEFVSAATERQMGYDPEELVGQRAFEYVHQDDRPAVREAFDRLLDEPGQTETIQYRFRHADGGWRWVETTGRNRFDNPAIGGVLVNSTDVTDRREDRRRLREERAFTESVLAALPDVLYAFDTNGEFLRWNDRLTDVTGYTDAEIQEMSPAELIAEPDRPRVTRAISEVFEEGRTATVEARFETKVGDRIPYEFTGSRLVDEDGTLLGLVGIGRDVSDRKERERRFEAVFDNTDQFMALTDPDGTVLEVNEPATAFLDADRNRVVGDPVWEAPLFEGDVADTVRDAVATAREGRPARDEIAVRGVNREAVVDFSVMPITDEAGEVRLLVPEGREITQLKERERHLDALHRFLRHNLRNEMTVIRGYARLIEADPDGANVASYACRVTDSAAELVELSETANELSRAVLEADGDRRPVNAITELDRVIARIRERYPDTSVGLEGPDGQRDAAVLADWRLDLVFEQLLENAVEHAGSPVTVRLAADGEDAVVVEVADDGPGIPDIELAGIGVGRDESQLAHPSGFGLRLAAWVVDDYGGRISFESAAEGGSVVRVRLPTPGPDYRSSQ